jgi:NADH-quinone oxidoreductase subunit L
MFVAAGLGAYWVALFHLGTHAFFKSVLFLGAGNVMHATNDEINIKKMGGLKKHMPQTALIMTIASVALAGIFPLAGFFSKDLILEAAFGTHHFVIWTILWITAGLTAFYSFRLVMYVFYGKENYDHSKVHPHETYSYVIAAMTPLAVLAICAGWFEHQFVHMVTHILPELEVHVTTTTLYGLIVVTTAIALGGIIFAVKKFKKGGTYYSKQLEHGALYKLLANQYYIPHIIDNVLLKPYLKISQFSWKEIDMKIIDTIVDTIANGVYTGGKEARVMQTGNLSRALKWMVTGIVILLILVIIGTIR